MPVCPEVAGGLPVPRPRSEIAGAAGGAKVLAGIAKVVDTTGRDVTAHFVSGAEKSLERAHEKNIRVAILKENSPSCGTHFNFDGTFSGRKVPNLGVTAARLQQAGIHVFSEHQLAEADDLLKAIEAGKAA